MYMKENRVNAYFFKFQHVEVFLRQEKYGILQGRWTPRNQGVLMGKLA